MDRSHKEVWCSAVSLAVKESSKPVGQMVNCAHKDGVWWTKNASMAVHLNKA